jgi:hypothetical protein
MSYLKFINMYTSTYPPGRRCPDRGGSEHFTFSKFCKISYLTLLFVTLFIKQNLFAQVRPSIIWDQTLGGSNDDLSDKILAHPDGGFMIFGITFSPVSGDVSHAPRSVSNSTADLWIVKTDANGHKIWDKRFGSVWQEEYINAVATPDGGYVLSSNIRKTSSAMYTVPDPNLGDVSRSDFKAGASRDGWVLKIDSNGNKVWDTRLGTLLAGGDVFLSSVVNSPDGGFLVGGYTNAVAASLDVSQTGAGNSDYWIAKLDANGNKIWDKRYASNGNDAIYNILPTIDGGYLLGGNSTGGTGYDKSENARGGSDFWIVKIDGSGNKIWDKTLGSLLRDNLNNIVSTADGGYLLSGNSENDFFNSPPGGDRTAAGFGSFDNWLIKIDGNGTKIWEKIYGTSLEEDQGSLGNHLFAGKIISAPDGNFYLATSSEGGNEGSKTEISRGLTDYWILKIDPNGSKIWDKTLGSIDYDINSPDLVPLSDGSLLFAGSSSLPGGDKTGSRGAFDMWLVKLSCASSTSTTTITNDVSPATQTACINGTAQLITGTDDDGLYPDKILYQWQKSTDGVNGWADITNGITKDYLPEPSVNTMYYRRVASWECNEDISNVAVVNINGFTAPTLNMGGPYYTCTGSPVTLGSNPIASGGSSPYTYSWDNPTYLSNATAANPLATVSATSIFTLTVTDANGCKKVDQAQVNIPPSAFAGIDATYCPGTSGIKLGSPPTPGLTGVTYSWAPTTGLNNNSVAQPIASPSSTTDYTLTITYTNSNGQVCNVSDQVRVTVSTPPQANFAGPDVTICSGAEATLGLAAQNGFAYTWSPGLYLVQNNVATPTFRPGTPFPPVVDPITYTVTATDGSCVYTDQVVVTVIKADAGMDGCGPRTIGTLDLTANVNETYSWTRLASSTGNGSLTGATNLPIVEVSGTNSGVDTYELSVSHGGTTCVSTVDVPICGDCGTDFVAEGGNCLLYNGKPLKLIADAGGEPGFTYTWSPAAGLSSTTGAVVYLLDGVNRDYTLTKTSITNASYSCSVTHEVNPPATSYPVFSAPDVAACNGTTLTIGALPVSGYTYSWTGPESFTSSSSNPSVTVSSLTSGIYVVKVEDTDPAQEGGCFVIDSVRVSIEQLVAPQSNWTVCSNAVIKLGTPDPSGGTWTYNWTPSVAAWQNGTGPNSAQPEVLVTTNTTFTVTVTNSSGCSETASSTINVTNTPVIENAPDVSNACEGSKHMIGSPALPGVTYSWSPSIGLSDPNIAQPTVTVGLPGTSVTYTVTATFPGTCSATATDQVVVTAINSNFSLGADITYCPANGPVSIGANAPVAGITSYSWTPEVGLSDPRIANPTTSVTTATEYTLTVTHTNGCIGTGKVTVRPTSSLTAGSDRTICYGSSTTLGSASNTGTPTWTGTGLAYLSSTSGAVITFNADGTAPAGTYNFTATQSTGGCTVTDNITVVVSPAFSVPAGGVTVCLNGTGSMGTTAQSNYTYSWIPSTSLSNPNSATTDVSMSEPGTYNYTLYVQNVITGCVSSAKYVVTVLPTSAPVVSVPDVTACLATPFTLNPSISPSGTNYAYVWSPATGLSDPFSANPVATVNSTRIYTLSVTDNSTGCTSQASGTVTVSQPNTSFIITSPNNSTACSGTPVTLTATVLAGFDYAYNWQRYNAARSLWENLSNGGLYSGVNSTSLNISDNTTLNGARFRLEVTSVSCGNKQQSGISTLTVNQCLKSSLGDKVWNDADKDGIQDAGEIGVAGVTASLYRNGVVIAMTTTDIDGYYNFDNLDAYDPFGNLFSYQIKFTNLPVDYVFTKQGLDAGTNGAGTATDSDVDPTTGMSRPVTLAYGINIPDVDAGIYYRDPLPVTLARFNAVGENRITLLTWATSAETNSSAFEIQRSKDAKQWTVIATVEAQGQSNALLHYNHTDSAPLEGINYYRLKMIDQDATFSFSRIVSVDLAKSLSAAVVFPNPATDHLWVNSFVPTEVKEVQLINASGVTLYKGEMPKSGINLKEMSPGAYVLKVHFSEGKTEAHKVVIVK